MSTNDPAYQACDDYFNAQRRALLRTAGRLCALGAISAPAWLPKLTFAQEDDASRDLIVQVFLRGGADGLTMCVPHADADYYTARSTLAIPDPTSLSANKAIDLDGFFGLPPALSPLKALYDAGEMAIVHATGFPFVDRSHFDAMTRIELGTGNLSSVTTGWLARHLLARQLPDAARILAMSPMTNIPLSLQGSPQTVALPDIDAYGFDATWDQPTARAPFLDAVYSQADSLIKQSSMAMLDTLSLVGTFQPGYGGPAHGATYPNDDFGRGMEAIARVFKASVGLEVACIDYNGWDHHAGQGPVSGDMATKMTSLANALLAFRTDLDADFDNVTIVVMSEFGRRVAQNGSAGTDHGTGGVMFVLGGNANGGQVITDWPGLDPDNLAENIDLPITIDARDVLAEVLQKRAAATNLAAIFPGFTPTFRNVVS
jgi:uncharacterized protein (DUF1501 family)